MPLNTQTAQVLASSTKVAPIWEGISPRWLCKLLPWVQVKAGVYRINQVTTPTDVVSEHHEGTKLPDAFADFEANPTEITLSTAQTVVQVHTRIPDLFSAPHDQLREQFRLGIEALKEEKERQIVSSHAGGLLTIAAEKMRIQSSGGPPAPDDLDNLLSLVWKKPAFFLAHPRGIAAFCRECNSRRLSVETVEMFGVPFPAWRGVPLVPSDKVPITRSEGKQPHDVSSFLLMRVGEADQGVIGLSQEGHGQAGNPVSVRFMGIDQHSVSRYLLTCYYSVVALANDGLGVLHNVAV